jgi:hypothetical protein|eukprot:COSAG01_NODE_5447_length_4258_cov_13.569127_2_plen_65_part_00
MGWNGIRRLPLPGTCVYYAGARCWLSFNPIIALSSAHLAFRRMCLAETQPFDTTGREGKIREIS